MVLLSGEVETSPLQPSVLRGSFWCSGWFCYPGKLKPLRVARLRVDRQGFRMVLLSGEVETIDKAIEACFSNEFRMVLLSGEVETAAQEAIKGYLDDTVPDGFAIRGS